MGIDDILENEPMYAGHLEDARAREQHRARVEARTEANGGQPVATPDGGVAVSESRGMNLSLGSFGLEFNDTETLLLALLAVNTAMTAGLLFAVLAKL